MKIELNNENKGTLWKSDHCKINIDKNADIVTVIKDFIFSGILSGIFSLRGFDKSNIPEVAKNENWNPRSKIEYGLINIKIIAVIDSTVTPEVQMPVIKNNALMVYIKNALQLDADGVINII